MPRKRGGGREKSQILAKLTKTSKRKKGSEKRGQRASSEPVVYEDHELDIHERGPTGDKRTPGKRVLDMINKDKKGTFATRSTVPPIGRRGWAKQITEGLRSGRIKFNALSREAQEELNEYGIYSSMFDSNLTQEERKMVPEMIERANITQHPGRPGSDRVAYRELSPREKQLMKVLWEMPGVTGHQTLAREAFLSPYEIPIVIDKLVEKGYLDPRTARRIKKEKNVGKPI